MNRLHRLFLTALALWVAAAQAQVRTEGLVMPQALQGLPAAGSQCGLSQAEKLQAQQSAALYE